MALTTERQNGRTDLTGKWLCQQDGKLAPICGKSTTIKGDHTDNKK